MGVSPPQAEAMKQEIGLRTDVADQAMIASRVIDGAASTFVDEVRGSLDYYTASTGSANISRLILTGGGSRLAARRGRLRRPPVSR